MRLKLVPDYNHDPHIEASALRDNMGMSLVRNASSLLICHRSKHTKNVFFFFFLSSGADSPRNSEPLPLVVAKEAKVSDMEDDQLGEEDLVYLDNK